MERPNDQYFRKTRFERERRDAHSAKPPPPKHCARKKRYASRGEAMKGGRGALGAAVGMQWHGPRPDALYVYSCAHCKGWHLTSRPGPTNYPVALTKD